MKKIFMLSVFLSTAQSTFCTEVLSKEIKNALKSGIYEPNLLSVLFALAFVVCLIYATGLIYAKLNVFNSKTVKKQFKDIDDTRIIIHSTTPIGQHRTLHVIEVDGKKMLIGSAQNSIHLIKELDNKKSDIKKSVKAEFEDDFQEFDLSAEDETLQESEFLDKIYKKPDTEDSVYKKYL